MKSKRLPRNFHKSFKPERQYLTSLLRYISSGRSGDFQEIADATGIPMGSSSGKVPAILDYSRGMGLIKLEPNSNRSSKKSALLTNFGRVVLLEDPFLKCEISQWLAHFNMCSQINGADIWYYTFFEGTKLLGSEFKREQLEQHLRVIYGLNNTNLIGPMVGMYDDEASFKKCAAIRESSGHIVKKTPPILDEMGYGYGAWVLQLLEDYFPKQHQVSITDLDRVSGWQTIPGWSNYSVPAVLDLLERKGLISVDRQMNPWLIQSKMRAEQVWRNVYIDII